MIETRAIVGCDFDLHPVGQGLFYSGRVGDFSFVYDCGSDSPRDFWYPVVERHIAAMPRLDMLIVSHFDSDHINGIVHLLRSRQPARVLMPYIAQEEMLLHFINAGIDTDALSFLQFCASRMYSAGFPNNPNYDTRVSVIHGNDDKKSEDLKPETPIEGLGAVLSHHTNVVVAGGCYKFRFFNSNAFGKNKTLLDELEKQFGSKWRDSLPDLVSAKLSDLKAVYEKVFGKKKLNYTSLVCCHGPTNMQGLFWAYHAGTSYAHRAMAGSSGGGDMMGAQLLTGDISFKDSFNEISRHYRGDLEKVSLCLVPHHGAKSSWDPRMFNLMPNCFFWPCSFGLGNKHKHPSAQVVAQFVWRQLLPCTQCGFGVHVRFWIVGNITN